MKPEVKEKLVKEYNSLKNVNANTSLKFWFVYNNININIYFDAFDIENPAMTLILLYDNTYYYTPLNISNTVIRTEYLKEIPKNILNKICTKDKNKKLNDFFENIEKYILENKANIIYYNEESIFTKTMKFRGGKNDRKNDLPFLKGIRKVRMSEDTLKHLQQTMGIENHILRKIQRNNITLVRTIDPFKRKKLILILKEAKLINIE